MWARYRRRGARPIAPHNILIMPVASQATQKFIPIREIRDGVVILKDGSMRMVVLVSSSNFALKSEDEQIAILGQFQSMLNTLDFPIQIFIQSRRLDIRPYLQVLRGRLRAQLSDLMRIQMQEYIDFIRSFTESTNIMTKTFFVVVPSSRGFSGATGGGGLLDFFKKSASSAPSPDKIAKEAEAFEEARSQMQQRVAVVIQGLARTGLRAVPLETEELTELYYKFFNPGETEKPIGAER